MTSSTKMSSKSFADTAAISRRMDRIFWTELILTLVVWVLGGLGLLLQPRPLFLWLPSVLALVAVTVNLAGVLSLDKAAAMRYNQPILLYIVVRCLVLVLMLLVCCLIIIGYTYHGSDDTTPLLWVSIPLLIVSLLHSAFGLFAIARARQSSKQLPNTIPPNATLRRRMKHQVASAGGFKNGGALPNGQQHTAAMKHMQLQRNTAGGGGGMVNGALALSQEGLTTNSTPLHSSSASSTSSNSRQQPTSTIRTSQNDTSAVQMTTTERTSYHNVSYDATYGDLDGDQSHEHTIYTMASDV